VPALPRKLGRTALDKNYKVFDFTWILPFLEVDLILPSYTFSHDHDKDQKGG